MVQGIAQSAPIPIGNGDVIDGPGGDDKRSSLGIQREKTDSTCSDDKELQFDCEIDFPNSYKELGAFESISLRPKADEARMPCGVHIPILNDVSCNGNEMRTDDVDSDTECTEPSESKSENTICDGPLQTIKREIEKSVETSTETLVSENFKCRYVLFCASL